MIRFIVLGRRLRTYKKPKTGTPCGYCFERLATGFDHLVPVSYRLDNCDSNLYPACIRCNRLAGNLLFDSIEEKREYVRKRLIERGEWFPEDLRELPAIFPTKTQVAEILRPQLPLDKMGKRASQKIYRQPAKNWPIVACCFCENLYVRRWDHQKLCCVTCRSARTIYRKWLIFFKADFRAFLC
jgi:hypothetical protein